MGTAAYFPRGGAEKSSKITTPELPFRPTEFGPVFDTEHATDPISTFDQEVYDTVYGGPTDTGEALVPAPPAHFNDKYLFPSLSRNERLRLTLLWYHTITIEQDEVLLSKVDALVSGVQQAIGWEYAIAGILDESTYTRLATANLPIARLPRREATCAHTINQKSGSVFMMTDMSKDWRFRESPHVEIGGLRSYAGTQLRLMADHGEEISLGSLCVASDSPQPPLSSLQRDLLVRFAELISSTIASHTRQRRLKKREEMGNLLSALQTAFKSENETRVVEVVRQAYPEAQVSLQVSADGTLLLEGQHTLSFSEVTEGLWEDTRFIESTIRNSNYARLISDHAVRAVIARCGSSDKYLVVATRDVHNVFDDYDAWYVSKSASMIADALQGRLLQQALEAKETFLRGMTHQLRTPIHGILGSVELLAEELATRRTVDSGYASTDGSPINTSPAACIATIRNSGKELMTTVNNILKHNTWTDALKQNLPKPYDLRNLEGDILPEVLALLPLEQLHGVSIDFRSELPDSHFVFITDAQLLKDCVQAVVLNAAQAVLGSPSGVISVTVRATTDLSWLMIDVVDNGRGINIRDQERIFEPYEKVDSHRLGAGLGLTLARKIASILGGSVTLLSSALGSGSHFRVEFKNPTIIAPSNGTPKPALSLEHLPRSFADVRCAGARSHFVDHIAEYLTMQGFQPCELADAGLVITNTSTEETITELRAANPKAAIVECDPVIRFKHNENESSLIPVVGPLHTEKLVGILQKADRLYKSLSHVVAKTQVPTTIVNRAATKTPPKGVLSPSILKVADIELEDASSTCRMNQTSPPKPLKALLVDDNVINLRVLQMFCHKRRIPYVTAQDGNQAIGQYKQAVEAQQPFTLVLMDLQMPRCDGIQATGEIRAFETQHYLESSSIFMVTGQDSPKDKTNSRNAGADEFLVKPIGPKELDKYIAYYFRDYIPSK